MKVSKILILGLCSLSFMGSVPKNKPSESKNSEGQNTPIREQQEHKKDSLISEFRKDAEETLKGLETFAKKQAYKKKLERLEKQKIRDYMQKVEKELSKNKIRVLVKQDNSISSQTQQVDLPILLDTNYGESERDSLYIRYKFPSSKYKERKHFYSINPISE